ncbi:major facilitator superfamily domain-containing protein [Cladorrhinum sp. PSN259]|nr:major facilitator superfamily domain-containing protein [Cladorrhinum sp. PSN259]
MATTTTITIQTATELHPISQYRQPTASSNPPTQKSNHDPLILPPSPRPATLSPAIPNDDPPSPPGATQISSPRRTLLTVLLLATPLFLTSFTNGLLVVSLPHIQFDSSLLSPSLLIWPTSAYYLTAGSCLLLSGTLSDVIGAKRVNVFGCLLGAIFSLACGFARTGGELIAFRALQGLSYAIVTPSGLSIISHGIKEGRGRNMGFAAMGFSQPLGFCVGLVLAGVFVEIGSVGWRVGFWVVGALSFVCFGLGAWGLPRPPSDGETASATSDEGKIWKRLGREIDWVGVGVASTGLASLSYVLATLSAETKDIKKASTIVLVVIASLSVPAFIGWMHRQTKRNRPALIPNSLWRSGVFTSSCIMVLITNAVLTCMELYSSLFFQEVQEISASGASVRIIPSLVTGVLTNILTGIFVNRMPVFWTVLITSVMSAAAPLLMALVKTDQPYWENAFFAQVLSPISCDLLFTVGLLIISDVYPKHMQALGGAVFNTCAQLGAAIGLSVVQVIASSVTNDSKYQDKESPVALMKGYVVAFWVMFGAMVFCSVVCILGLRRVGKVGVKRD